ncbi:MAG: hypothetical protein M5U28_18760 [Sandaracinaceae bacterium]|nr:hypothetical protein [Sandaracinaceae bacterium]
MRGRLPLGAAAMLAVGIVLGFFLGGLAPRRELAEREERIAQLTRELEEGGPRGGFRSPVPGLDRILRDPEPPPSPRGVPLPAAGGERAEPRAEGTLRAARRAARRRRAPDRLARSMARARLLAGRAARRLPAGGLRAARAPRPEPRRARRAGGPRRRGARRGRRGALRDERGAARPRRGARDPRDRRGAAGRARSARHHPRRDRHPAPRAAPPRGHRGLPTAPRASIRARSRSGTTWTSPGSSRRRAPRWSRVP